jgi:prophage antirepressor-like protein
MVDHAPWWVGRDVCEALKYQDSVNALKRHCRGVPKRHPIVDALGRTQRVRIIHEGDVWRLITNSHLPEAERFEKWLFETALPEIRRTGAPVPEGMTLVRKETLKDLEDRILRIETPRTQPKSCCSAPSGRSGAMRNSAP